MNLRSRSARALIGLALLLSALTPLRPGTPVTAQTVPSDVDIAAISLTTDDLHATGYEDYYVGQSEMTDILEFPNLIGFTNGLNVEEQLEILDEAGFLRAHAIWFRRPPEAGETESSRQITSIVAIYDDARGAQDAFELLEDESESAIARDLPGWDGLGDASEATSIELADDRQGIVVSVRVDNIYFRTSEIYPAQESLDERALTDLIDVLIDRIDIGLAATQPALSNLILRFESKWGLRDLYFWRDGSMVRYVDDSEQDVELYIERSEMIGQTEHYGMRTVLNLDRAEGPELEVVQLANLYRYEDENAAAADFAGIRDDIMNDDRFSTLDLEDAGVGDEAFAFDAEIASPDVQHRSMLYARFDDVIISFGFTGPSPVRDALDSMAGLQIECFEEGDCIERAPLTAEIADLTGDVVENDFDDEDDSDDYQRPASILPGGGNDEDAEEEDD